MRFSPELFCVAIILFFLGFFLPQQTMFCPKKVYFGEHSHGPQVTSADLNRVTENHHEFLASFLTSKEKAKDVMFYSYKRHINAFAAILEEEDAAQIAKHPNVISVLLDKRNKLHTTHSWDFLMLERYGSIHSNSLWNKARFGEDAIIANLDSGVWPESESFRDEEFGPVPSKWKGICQNDTEAGVPCNRKLIGARYFNKGYFAANMTLNSSMESARDFDGHGTHTLSTAGGNFVAGANVHGTANGTVKGGSPKARVATYKVCWSDNCFDSDILKGFDMAIHDGVDVLSMSLGGNPADYWDDAAAIGAFHAVRNGVIVVASAGNSGPLAGTVTNVAPWFLTVGATTIDREYQAFLELPNGLRLKGLSRSKALPEARFYPMINSTQAKDANASTDEASLCMEGSLDRRMVKGKILVCTRGGSARVDKGVQAAKLGAIGMILCNDESTGGDLSDDPHVLPTTHINYTDALALYTYRNSSENPVGFITPPVARLDITPAPIMASFSSNGPNAVTPEILKPDIVAPGVNIMAAVSEAKTDDPLNRVTSYDFMMGTSMSCPHVSGVAGLLKTLHPHWTPAAIRSAIVTTARIKDNKMRAMVDGNYEKATPFNYGGGHLRPNRAMDPGLVYDLTPNDYLDFLCASHYNKTMIQRFTNEAYECPKASSPSSSLLNFNYPSITIPKFSSSSVSVTRRVKNVGSSGSVYRARIRPPLGFSASVEPNSLRFEKSGEEKSFVVTLKANNATTDYAFGELLWTDGSHFVRSPISIAAAAPA